jgi:quercetin dioxygenase-like cupin family protein
MGSDRAIGGHRTFKSTDTLHFASPSSMCNSHVCACIAHVEEATP